MLLAIDEEGGDVTRLEWRTGSSYPGGAALGVVDEPSTTEAVAASIASELAAAGVNWNLAPVADVNVPANPVIGCARVRLGPGARRPPRRGVRPRDAVPRRRRLREALPRPRLDRAGLASRAAGRHAATSRPGLEPFRAAIAAGVQTIMTAHVRVPALDDAPATLSRAIVHGLLRGELGFDGLVLADALEMKAVSATVGDRGGGRARARGRRRRAVVGHDLGEDDVVPRPGRARRDGARGAAREAAARVAALADWAQAAPPAPSTAPLGRRCGAACAPARRRHEVPSARRRIVELRPRANIAAGEPEHSLGEQSSAKASRSRPPTCTSCATRTVIPGCRRRPTSTARSSSRPGCRSGDPSRGARVRRDVRRRPRLARARPSCSREGVPA